LISPKAIVVLNLFRDQLDRYGELDTTAALIGEGIVASQAQLYLNADDPLVASLAKYASNEAEVSFFGIEDLPAASSLGAKTATDSDRCPICHERLQFSRVFYSHIGHYGCDRGHFSRPKPTVAISELNKADLSGSDFTMVIGGRKAGVKLPLPGTYNLYNALAAASFLHGFGINISTIVDILTTSKPAFGRFERIELDGRTLYLLLIKNPAGFAQVMETFLAGRSDLRVMMAVNDLPADGRDVSWLWDVPLESLAQFKPIIVTAGIRGADMALRLHYAGIETEAADDLAQALKQLLKITAKGQTAYILTTYTAMIEIRKLLSKLTQMSEV